MRDSRTGSDNERAQRAAERLDEVSRSWVSRLSAVQPRGATVESEVEPTGAVGPSARRFDVRHLRLLVVVVLCVLVVSAVVLLRARATVVPLTMEAGGSAPSPLFSSVPGPAGAPSATVHPVVVVHVLGAVRRPGVVSLPVGSRVTDAIKAAGGLTRQAAVGELNLAGEVPDGAQVIIGTKRRPRGEVRVGAGTANPAGSTGGASSTGTTGGTGAVTPAVDLNVATIADLDQLPGVGPVTAQRILDWRAAHGRFTRVEQLQEVDGIGPKTFAQIAPHVRVS